MRIRNVTEAEVIEFSTRDESHFYDRKAKEIKGAKVQKIAVAFANADGGEFLVGIADDPVGRNSARPHYRKPDDPVPSK